MPQQPGVYLFLDDKGTVLYVGKAKNLKHRVASYFRQNTTLGEKTNALVTKVKTIKITIVGSEIESLLLEANYIKKYMPQYNIRLTDGKAYPLIQITMGDIYPKVLVARRMEDKKSVYFGPYPNSGAMRLVLKTIRRIFPFQSVNNHPKRQCLYYHLGLCPCPPVFDSPELRKQYKKTVRHIIRFLQGDVQKLIKDLASERKLASKQEQFEEAQKLQDKINAIILITNPVHTPFEYETNPNLRSDLRVQELTSLQEILKNHHVTIAFPERIECYDISNTQGNQSVASMVVLTNGEKDSSQYRKFKITDDIVGPNDFASMKQVLQRRLRHTEWPFPNLFIVDGGKGQISSALEVLRENNIAIPLVGLAKREETIITSDFKEIVLPKDSPALLVVMRIRDEAHRFAITYHKKLRSKKALE